ncbi:hypothetical protein ABK040_004743 [Willaertia magna]
MQNDLLIDISSIHPSTDGWGPQALGQDSAKTEILQLPTNLFHIIPSKTSIGKIADWTEGATTGTTTTTGTNVASSTSTSTVTSTIPGAITGQDEFALVTGSSSQKNKYTQKRRVQTSQTTQHTSQQKAYSHEQMKQLHRTLKQKKKKGNAPYFQNRSKQVNYKPSIKVKKSWQLVEKFAFPTLKKVTTDPLDNGKGYKTPEPEDKLVCGKVSYYDRRFDRVSAKQAVNLEKPQKLAGYIVQAPAASEDPNLSSKISKDANVFATDEAIAMLMSSPRSELPWDMAVRVVEGKIYLDLRKLEGRMINLFHSVAETSSNPPSVDEKNVQSINSAFSLSKEATLANAYFLKQAFVDNEVKTLGDAPPFSTGVFNLAYKYREFKLSDNITLLVRCELNGLSKESTGDEEMTFRVLNEYFPPDPNAYQIGTATDWKANLDTQKTSIIMAEFKNNACKMAKWTAQALLNSSKQFKLGFVSRQNPKVTKSHLILGTEKYRPEDFADQLHLNLYNMWGIVKLIVEFIQKFLQENNKTDSEFVLLKHPNRERLELYEVPEVEEEFDEEASLNSNASDEDDEDEE